MLMFIDELKEKFDLQLEDFLHKSKYAANQTSIIIGDINIDILADYDYAHDYLNILYSNGFRSFVNQYTRQFKNQNSCIDHIFIKSSVNAYAFKPIIYRHNVTDHYPIILQTNFDSKREENHPAKFKTYINYAKLYKHFSREVWNDFFKLDHPNDIAQNLIEKIGNSITKNTIKVKTTKKHRKRKDWVTTAVLNSVNKKNEMYRLLSKDWNNEQLHNDYKKYKNRLTTVIHEAKKNYFKTEINKNRDSPRKLWNCIKNLCNENKDKNTINHIMTASGTIENDKNSISNMFVDYYSNVGSKLASKFSRNNNYKFFSPRSLKSFFIEDTDPKEVEFIISNLKTHKSPGTDGITTEVLKTIVTIVSTPITYLVNKIFQSGIYPSTFKIGVIKPIYRSGKKTEMTNYRPITLISSLAKVFEKVLKSRIESFLEKNKILSENQFGFKKGVSTQDAILYLTNHIYESLDKKIPTVSVFIDLAKAFDTVSHRILLNKLEHIGFRGVSFRLIESYLNNRTNYVEIDNILSECKIFEYGVPQGTVLGPLLFNIYINDLLNIATKSMIQCFADDTVITYQASSWIEIQEIIRYDITIIKNWFDSNLLTINFDKSYYSYLPFSSYINTLPNFGPIEIDKRQIFEADSVKYLGIIIDKHLKWDLQIKFLSRKVRQLLPKFKFLREYLNTRCLETLYYSLVPSQLNYGILGWGGVHQTHLKSISSLQKCILKVIYYKEPTYPSNNLFKESQKFDIRQLFSYNILTFVHKHKNYINFNSHEHNTRTKNRTLRPPIFKSIGQKSLIYLCCCVYDLLPASLKSIKSYIVYKKSKKNE
nr:unnamed protein product [Callosobruchus analis]